MATAASRLPHGLSRAGDDRLVAGVCGGAGGYLGVDPIVVRLAVCVLSVANGIGVILYAIAWAVLPESVRTVAPERPAAARTQRSVGVALVTLGVLLLARESGVLLLPDALIWPAALAAAGFGIAYAKTGGVDRGMEPGAKTLPRLVAGGVLLTGGLLILLATNDLLAAVSRLVLAVIASAMGVALLLGPWIVRLWRDLADERRERIRSEERAEMAAHLHDSVLQTLALIQRHADSPGRARTLARRQERELRAWLYGDRPANGAATLTAALDAVASEVEERHEVEVEVVVVGDRPLDPRLDALVLAVREAAHNAARHSGAAEVSVYVEVEDDRVTAFVRDRGKGFDPEGVEPGHFGLSESIIGRMTRAGGRAEVQSTVGEGTEVMIEVGIDRTAAP